jgi:hypothetical protein
MEIRIRATGQLMFGEEFNRTICSLPITPALLNLYGADPVLEGPQPTAGRYQFVFRDGVEQINGEWFTKYSVADLDADAIAAKDAAQAKAIREERDNKLAECDWRVIKALESNVPQDFEWAAYRQALRDVPTQAGFPWTVDWPAKP